MRNWKQRSLTIKIMEKLFKVCIKTNARLSVTRMINPKLLYGMLRVKLRMWCIRLSILRKSLLKLLWKPKKTQKFHHKWLKVWIGFWSRLRKIKTVAILMWDLRAIKVKPAKGHSKNQCTKIFTRKNLLEIAPRRRTPTLPNPKSRDMTKSTLWSLILWRKKKKLLSEQNRMTQIDYIKEFGRKRKRKKREKMNEKKKRPKR